MSLNQSIIVFVDNSINRIFKTIETLKQTFQNIFVFNQEKEFFNFLEENKPDAIFLNLDMQPNDALILLKEIKNRFPNQTPFVIIYSEKSDDFVQELAFNSGADSFISFHNKISVLELFLKNLLRRKKEIIVSVKREVVIDNESYLIYKNGEAIQLPRKEFKLFELLYNHSDQFLSKLQIAGLLWKDESVASKRTIDVHIYNIRQFFGKRIIQSQKGRGYRMNRKMVG